jgi:hypothetical protein
MVTEASSATDLLLQHYPTSSASKYFVKCFIGATLKQYLIDF